MGSSHDDWALRWILESNDSTHMEVQNIVMTLQVEQRDVIDIQVLKMFAGES